MTKAEIPSSRLWERQADEPNKWFDRFQVYLLLGASRSVYAAYSTWRERSGASNARKRAGLPQSWRQAAAQWNWETRAEAFDENERAEQMVEWGNRRDALREQEWKFSQELLDKVRQMLVFPLAKTVRTAEADGKTTITEVHPTRWTVGDAARMLEAASKLGRLAVGEDTERIGVSAVLTSDDMVQAAKAAKVWEQETYQASGQESGLSTDNPDS